MCDLKSICAVIGCFLAVVSVAGIGFSLFLVFGDPFNHSQLVQVQGTYEPSWEDIGPAMVVSVVSLLMNIILVGGAIQGSRGMLSAWTVWNGLVVLVFWAWYGYSQLKYYSYIDWSDSGMKSCYFCGDPDIEEKIWMGGAVASAVLAACMVMVSMLRSRLKKLRDEMTELASLRRGNSINSALASNHPNFYPIQNYAQMPPASHS